jgi:drug/metabolite transporter (DMT)-like permease
MIMIEPWVPLSLLSAFSLATSDALTKKIITHENEYVIAWYRIVFTLPVLYAVMVLSGPLPRIDGPFLAAFSIALPLEIVAILLYYKALRVSPLSLSLPFLSFTPVFLVVWSFVLLGQPVSPKGAAGIALIGLGGYTLNLSALRTGFLEPIRAVVRERGSLYMLIIALIYSVTASLGKIGVDHTSPSFFGFFYFLALAVFLLPIMAGKSGKGKFGGQLRNNFRVALLPAFFDAVATVSYFYAISMVNVAYMIAVKRTSLLISAVYGFLLFRERNIRERLIGAVLMFAGFVVVVIGR